MANNNLWRKRAMIEMAMDMASPVQLAIPEA
jgi:hypothetical protein